MKNLQAFSLCLFLGLFSVVTQAAPFNKEVLIRKGVKWLAQNQSLKRVKQRLPAVTYEKEELILKILQVLEEEKAFGLKAYYVLIDLVRDEHEITKKHKAYVASVIEKLEMDAKWKSELSRILNEKSVESGPVKSEQRVLQKDGVSIPELLRQGRETISGLTLPQGMKDKLTGSLDTVKKILLDSIPADDCYNNNPNCQFSKNAGIIYYYSKKIHQNHALALATLRMGIRIHKLNIENAALLANGPLYDQVFNLNLWPMLLDVADDDAALAMDVLSVFGHDVVSNSLYNMKENLFLTSALNTYQASNYGNDSNPRSVLYLPGALDGALPRRQVLHKLARAYDEYNRVHGTKESLRNAYYHVYGGVLMAQELISAGYGQMGTLDISALISTAMGYAYKQQQMEMFMTTDAITLWTQINYNEYKLKKLNRPEGWDELRFEKAKAVLKVRLAVVEYTEEQHRVGARFAIKVYKSL